MKKISKKLGAVVLALCMCFSLCATAFAAGECSITIENSVKGNTYYAYKIFDATYDDDGNVAYTIKATDPWYSLVTSDAGKAYFTVSTTADANGNYTVQQVEGASDDALITWLKSCITVADDGTATVGGTSITAAGNTTATGDGAKITGLDSGYYFVSTNTGSLVSVTTADPDATIIDKNPVIGVEKVITHEGSEDGDHYEAEGMGSDVSFDVTATVPKYEGENYVLDYTLTDSMTNGLLIELEEGDYYYDEETGNYYLSAEKIKEWVHLYDGAGNEIDFTKYVYAYSFVLEGYDEYIDETSGNTVHTFSGFILTYYTYNVDQYAQDLWNALNDDPLINIDEAWPEGSQWPIPEVVEEEDPDFDFPSEAYFEAYDEDENPVGSVYPANATIEINYTAHVSSLEGYENTNKITLDYDVTPFTHPVPWQPTDREGYEDEDYVYSWELQLLKISGDGEATPLEGATFKLESNDMKDVVVGHSYLYVDAETLYNAPGGIYTDSNGNEWNVNEFESTYYKNEGTEENPVWVVVPDDEINEDTDLNTVYHRILTDKTTEGKDTTYDTTGTTDAQGKLYFGGLGEGTYTLTEIIAPDGYNLLTEPIVFTISWTEENGFTISYAEGSNPNNAYPSSMTDGYILALSIENNAGTELPSTGGIGTTIFYIIGGVLVVGAVVVLVTRRRMTREG